MIKCFLKGQQREWDNHLACLVSAYRASPNESTRMTPNMLMLGREIRQPIGVMYGCSPNGIEEFESYGKYARSLREKLSKANEQARTFLNAAAKRQKDFYDAKSSLVKYKSGDRVWYLTATSQLNTAPKMRHPYEGPFLVVERINDLNYRIQLNARPNSQKIVHHDKLKPYKGSKNLRWANKALQGSLLSKASRE